jgi:hypothetical protein
MLSAAVDFVFGGSATSEPLALALSLTLALGAVFYGLNFAYLGLDALGLLDRYRIAPKERKPDPALVRRAWLETLFNHAVGGPLVFYYVLYPLMKWRGADLSTAPPEWPLFALQFLGCMVAEDTLFYWSHRALHHRWIYKVRFACTPVAREAVARGQRGETEGDRGRQRETEGDREGETWAGQPPSSRPHST